MYKLVVVFADDPIPRKTVKVAQAAEVMTYIPELLAEHDGCEHIAVYLDNIRLFGVDCAGNRVP